LESKSSPTAWAALGHPTFRRFWMAGVGLSSGQVVLDLCASWTMTSLTEAPLAVALLQTAVTLPVLLLAFPAGAMADLVDRRKWMIAVLVSLSVAAFLLGVLAHQQLLTVNLLLGLIFVIGCLSACFVPAWMRTVPDILSGHQIPWGVALNSAGVNVARMIGAGVSALILGNLIPAFGFFATGMGFLAPAWVLWQWRRSAAASSTPPESLPGAITGGMRYALHSPAVRRVALRTFAFSICGSALLALLPSIARQILQLQAFAFSMSWMAFGAGALLGATLLVPLRARFGVDDVLAAMSALVALAMWLIATHVNYWLWIGGLALAGAGWVGMVSSFGVAMGSASPPWVLSRMLSLYVLSFQGAAAVGSLIWGGVAQSLGPERALCWGAVLLGGTILLRWLAPMPEANPAALAPAREWPSVDGDLPPQDGPVLISIEYTIEPEDAAAFLLAMEKLRLARLRDGANQWFVFQCTDPKTSYLETFLVESWAGHLRQHERLTIADRAQQKAVNSFHRGPESPRVRHWLARGR
jgi:MFS family permease